MSQAIVTLYEGHYHYGVAALINSALLSGFVGRFVVGFRDRLPSWTSALNQVGEAAFQIEGASITFYQEAPSRHLGYHKPFAALSVFERFPDLTTLYYADPDVTFLAPWEFFQGWAAEGVGLVGDCNFRDVSPAHPWRRHWEKLLRTAGQSVERVEDGRYANSGYFSMQRSHLPLLESWRDLTLAYEQAGGDTTSFQMQDRWKAVVSDQDLLAAALIGWPGTVSWMGPEAMGFTGYFFILSHAVESPKPWVRRFALDALRGTPPSRAAKEYLQCANNPIRVQSKESQAVRWLDYRIGQLIARFYRRPN